MLLSIQNSSRFFIMMNNLIKAVKEGKISKPIGQLIIRKLKSKDVVIDPELVEIVNSELIEIAV